MNAPYESDIDGTDLQTEIGETAASTTESTVETSGEPMEAQAEVASDAPETSEPVLDAAAETAVKPELKLPPIVDEDGPLDPEEEVQTEPEAPLSDEEAAEAKRVAKVKRKAIAKAKYEASLLESDSDEDDENNDNAPQNTEQNVSGVDPLGAAPPSVREALRRRGFTELSKVQVSVSNVDGNDRDLQVSSQTGSGKTVAVGFALANILAKPTETSGPGDGPTALILVPTRELAGQVAAEFGWLFADMRSVDVAVVTGGTSVGMEARRLRGGPRVVVGTPGRTLDHIRTGALKTGNIQVVVLDEADQMLDMGFREELEAILEGTPTERRTHLVSATFPHGIKQIAARYQSNPLSLEGTRLGEANADIEHKAFLVNESDRYAALLNLLLLEGDQSILVFVNTRQDTTDISAALARDGFAAVPLSGELAQIQRTRTLDSFRAGVVRVLVATDVAARGLDIPSVGAVIHAATPRDAETYTHRSGRTGRAGAKGKSLLMVPSSRERHIRRLLGNARINASWCDIPAPELVRNELAARSRATILEAVQAATDHGQPTLDLATELLASKPAEEVISALINLVPTESKAEPRDLGVPQSWANKGKGNDRRSGGGQERGNYGNRDTRPGYQDRGGRSSYGGGQQSGGRSSYGDRPQYAERQGGGRTSYGASQQGGGGRSSYGDRQGGGDRQSGGRTSYGASQGGGGQDRGGRPSYGGDRQAGGRNSYGYQDRDRATERGNPSQGGGQGGYQDRGGRPSYNDRQGQGGGAGAGRSSYGDRPSGGYQDRDRGTERGNPRQSGGYGDRGNDRGGDRGGYGDRGGRPSYNDQGGGGRESYGNRGPRPDRPGSTGGPEAGYTRYELNWGGREGANPRRVLAMICRRGDCSGQDIGSIRINDNVTTFEVNERASRNFESGIQRPDPRDPHLTISRSGGGQ